MNAGSVIGFMVLGIVFWVILVRTTARVVVSTNKTTKKIKRGVRGLWNWAAAIAMVVVVVMVARGGR